MTETSFGETAIMTPANVVTIARLATTPVLLAMVLGGGASWPAVVFWVLLATTDGLDGYLARRHGTTRSGAFLDPLADKALVLGAMVALVVEGTLWWLPVALIAARELAMSAYRSVAGRHGVSLPARWLAKVKTVVQAIAVGFALLPLTTDRPAIYGAWLWGAVALTLASGAQYVVDGRRATRAL